MRAVSAGNGIAIDRKQILRQRHWSCIPAAERRPAAYIFCFRLYFLFIFNDSRQANYRKIYSTDLRQILRVICRTLSVDDRSEMSFSIPQGKLPWQSIFVGFSQGRI